MKQKLIALTLSSPLLLTGCFDTSNDNATPADYSAFISGSAPDFSSSSLAIVDAQDPSQVQKGLNPSDISDVTLSHYQKDFYMIYRHNANHIVKYHSNAPTQPVWDCSTEGNDTNSNPYQLVQISDNKAYVLRYGTGKIWIVNPSIQDSSQCGTDFKTGEIDLSSYDSDGVPEMATATVVNDKLYVGMQRLTFFSPEQDAQVAVIDTQTDQVETVIDTPARNIQKIQYVPQLNALYTSNVGKYAALDGSAPADYTGGIVKIDLATQQASLVVDDNADTQQISDMTVINESTGYLISYASYQNNTLYQFNPQTGEIAKDANGAYSPIAGLANQNLANLYQNPKNQHLWIGTTSGVTTVDTQTNEVVESLIDTGMNPTAMAFIEQ